MEMEAGRFPRMYPCMYDLAQYQLRLGNKKSRQRHRLSLPSSFVRNAIRLSRSGSDGLQGGVAETLSRDALVPSQNWEGPLATAI